VFSPLHICLQGKERSKMLSIRTFLTENADSDATRYTTCALFTGLCVGASFWGIGSDIMGRRLAFNLTLLIASVFGIAAGAAPSWIGACGLFAALGVGVGGNLPVDGALFLEFLPTASSRHLTLLSVWWPVGQLVASLIGWGFLGSHYAVDKGWRCKSSSGTSRSLNTDLFCRLRLHHGSHDLRDVPFSVCSVPPFRVPQVFAQQGTSS
jgi:MFS family permease